jgi:hypothetical protein
MQMKATLADLETRARKAVDNDESWLWNVATDMSPPQILDNVKHTRIFREAVMRWLARKLRNYQHLLEEL